MLCVRCGKGEQLIKRQFPNEPVCLGCYSEMWYLSHQVYVQRRRARLVNEADTLTAEEWEQTLNYFEWKCAYCQNQCSLVLEHFIPLGLGLGTIQGNCVPACQGCNRKKRKTHPSLVKTIPQEDIERVRTYLMSFL